MHVDAAAAGLTGALRQALPLSQELAKALARAHYQQQCGGNFAGSTAADASQLAALEVSLDGCIAALQRRQPQQQPGRRRRRRDTALAQPQHRQSSEEQLSPATQAAVVVVAAELGLGPQAFFARGRRGVVRQATLPCGAAVAVKVAKDVEGGGGTAKRPAKTLFDSSGLSLPFHSADEGEMVGVSGGRGGSVPGSGQRCRCRPAARGDGARRAGFAVGGRRFVGRVPRGRHHDSWCGAGGAGGGAATGQSVTAQCVLQVLGCL